MLVLCLCPEHALCLLILQGLTAESQKQLWSLDHGTSEVAMNAVVAGCCVLARLSKSALWLTFIVTLTRSGVM